MKVFFLYRKLFQENNVNPITQVCRSMYTQPILQKMQLIKEKEKMEKEEKGGEWTSTK